MQGCEPYPVAGDTLYVFFNTYGSSSESITITGLAVTDIEIYKDGSVTQRASDNGYALLDTDGIDFDGITGIHGISIDLSDNSDASFYTVGATYVIVVSAITVDAQTVNFVAGTFRIVSATRGLTGTAVPDAAADAAGGLIISDAGGLDADAQRTDVAAILVDTGTTLQAELDGIQSDTEDIQGRLPAALTADGNIKADTLRLGGTLQTARDIGASVLLSVGTGTGQVSITGGSVASIVQSFAAGAASTLALAAASALADIHLDHLISSADPGSIVANDSLWAKLVSKSATAAYSDYVNTTDSLQAIRDNIGTAGAGLTNITLPSGGLANIIAWTVNITGNLSGSVGSVSGAVGSISGITFPTNFASLVISGGGAVDSLVQGFLDNTIAETTADNIAANFEVFFDNADALTTKTVDDVGTASGGGADVRVTVNELRTG